MMYAYEKHEWNSFSDAEQAALIGLRMGKLIPSDDIPSKQTVGPLGDIEPGIRTYKALEKRGLIVFCEPIEDDDGFFFTGYLELEMAR